jgi:hypothetical protein
MTRSRETRATEVRARRGPEHRLTDEELLASAMRLVKRGWSRQARAEDKRGRPVEPCSGDACRWSPVGALQRAWCEGEGGSLEVFATVYLSLSLATGGRLEEWNAAPWRTKWHVLSAFERARRNLPQAREELGRR